MLLIDDLADTCFTLLNAVTQLVRVGGAKAVYVFVTHAVMSQMPQVTRDFHINNFIRSMTIGSVLLS